MKHEDIKAIQRRVDEILYYLWDPIGVKDEPAARSEYSSYAASISSLLISENDQESIAKQLTMFERDNMGMVPANEKHAMEIAEILIKAKNAIEEGLS
jgi:hypothetical protein